MALDLARVGVTRVRPLAGGFPEWQKRGFPVQPIAPQGAAPAAVRSAQTTGDAQRLPRNPA